MKRPNSTTDTLQPNSAKAIDVLCFTEKGALLAGRILREAPSFGYEARAFYKGSASPEGVDKLEGPAADLCREAFADRRTLLFIGAAGIAVRQIAPFIKDKLTDPAVLVMDELGQFVIPVLSGHVGGANETALDLSEITGAVPVITTATDINEAFSPDLFAKENRLTIVNREGIARVSKRSLEGKPVTISIKGYPPKEPVDVMISTDENDLEKASLLLSPKPFVAGIGCRKGKPAEEIEAFIAENLRELGADLKDLYAVATIDIKENEPGLTELSRRHRIPLISFDEAMLSSLAGDFTASEFVKETVGVDNVCERAAVLGAGKDAVLIRRKQAANGITCAIAKRALD